MPCKQGLNGYQNWTFPLGIYGCMDTFSRKVLFLYVCYLQFLYENETFSTHLRLDRGTEADLELEQFNMWVNFSTLKVAIEEKEFDSGSFRKAFLAKPSGDNLLLVAEKSPWPTIFFLHSIFHFFDWSVIYC